MKPNPLLVPILGVLFLLAATSLAQDPALTGLDPVRLGRGEEVPGVAAHQASHAGFTYRFATAADKQTFLADPERFGIQWGGACARMGPLSGLGDQDRWLVHDGRIYVFASDACRQGFARDAARFLAPDEAAPDVDGDAAARGKALLTRATAALGGDQALTAWRSYRHERTSVEGDTRQEWRLFVQFPGTVRQDHDWLQGEKVWRFHRVLTPDDCFFVDTGTARDMHAAARTEARRELLREPAFALRAALTGKVVVAGLGERELEGVRVEELQLWQEGCVTTFGIDEQGRVRTARYRGRGPSLWFGEVIKVYDDFERSGALTLPRRVRGTFDGKATARFDEQRTKVQMDQEPTADTFARPK